MSATTEVVPPIGAYPDAAFHEIYGDDSDIEIVDAAPIEEPPAPPARPTEPEINKQRLYEAKLELYRASAAIAGSTAQKLPPDDIEIVDADDVEDRRVRRIAACALSAPTPAASTSQTTPAVGRSEQRPPTLPHGPARAGVKPRSGRRLLDSGVIPNPAAIDPIRSRPSAA